MGLTRELEALTIAELRAILKNKGLAAGGTKAELLERLQANGISEAFLPSGFDECSEQQSDTGDSGAVSMDLHREIELARREKELMARELAIAKRELEFLQRLQVRGQAAEKTSRGEQSVPIAPIVPNRTAEVPTSAKVNVTTIAALLSNFDGSLDNFETWERQVTFLKTAYNLDDNMTKILIRMRLKGKALEWFHSKSEFIEMTFNDLLIALKGMFHHKPNKIILRRRFEDRVWKKDESFHDYVNEKVILANRIAIIEGIPDPHQRDIARVQRFSSRE